MSFRFDEMAKMEQKNRYYSFRPQRENTPTVCVFYNYMRCCLSLF